MRISLNVTNYSWPSGAGDIADHLDRVARIADAGGLDTVWVSDHLLQAEPGTNPEQEMLEAYVTLGFIAARTRRVRLGTMVTAATFRPPALLVKAVTTLDVLSGGRAWLGIGAGYLQSEADAMGLPLPPTAERFEHLTDTLRLAHQMWAGDDSAFVGAHHRLDRPVNRPNSLRRPHPPILVGGTGERKTLRLVAEYADACNVFDIPDGGATIRRKLGVLAKHCDAIGRAYDDVEKSVSTRLGPDESPEAFAHRCSTLAELGIDQVIVLTSGAWTGEAVERLAAAVPAVAPLGR
ncbi:MAG TPA: LLM class F420-dependent oxidoreductase, partial [Micromonosporaceae bacterium]